jgi:hypothetical protein
VLNSYFFFEVAPPLWAGALTVLPCVTGFLVCVPANAVLLTKALATRAPMMSFLMVDDL